MSAARVCHQVAARRHALHSSGWRSYAQASQRIPRRCVHSQELLRSRVPRTVPVTSYPIMVTLRLAGPSRHPGVSPAPRLRAARLFFAALVACVCVHARTDGALAQPTAAEMADPDPVDLVGPSANALRGLVYTGLPLGPREITLRASAGYGFIERISPAPGATQRVQGALAIGITPLPWLGFALRLDGRLNLHGDDGMGGHITGYGDPRLLARAGYALSPALWLGVEIGAWFPGQQAPSWVASATTLDGRVQAAYRLLGTGWTLLGSAGARWDNSARAAPELDRLRIGDRVALGLSDSSAILVALGAAWQVQPRVQVFAELAADLHVGSSAPPLSESPLRAAVGARYAITSQLQAELTPVISFSSRPSLAPGAAVVPIEPRVLVLLGISYTLPLTAAKPKVAVTEVKTEPPKPKPIALASVTGRITDEAGQPLPEVRVTLITAGGQTIESISDRDGNYHFESLPLGEAHLSSQAVGFKKLEWTVILVSGPTADAAHPLVPATNIGVLRGLVRSFDSTPLRAKITIKNARGKIVQTLESNDAGAVELELPPGRYTVTVEAPGHRKHNQAIQIKGNGVSVLNTDLRKKP